MTQDGKSPDDPTPSTPKLHTAETGSKMPIPAGITELDFLVTFDDFSDMVALWQKCDQIAHGEEPIGSEMSGKKCRFCG